MRVENKADVLKLRMDSATLQLLEQARHLLHLDKSKFIRQSIREKAQIIIAEHEKTHFNAEDWQVFFALLENPPEPSERMKKASSKYKEIMANHEV